jgi:peptide deformylase
MIRTVLQQGDPRLHLVAMPVQAFGTPELKALVADLWDTMRARDGAGLAAPQIGMSLRVVVFGFAHNRRYPDAPPVPHTVLCNPVLQPLDELLEWGEEGCLSVLDRRERVPRYARLRYTGFDEHGRPIVREVEGFHARVVQHECDHLDGILYPQRIRDLPQFGLNEVPKRIAPLANN